MTKKKKKKYKIKEKPEESLPAVLVLSNVEKIKQSNQELIDRLTDSTDTDEIKRIVQLFNVNQSKRDAIRAVKLSDMVDKVDNEMDLRLTTQPEAFRNEQLADYLSVLQQSTIKARQSVNQVDETPLIQFNQNNVNVTNGEVPLSRESRERVLAVVREVLGQGKTGDVKTAGEVKEVEYTEKEKKNE